MHNLFQRIKKLKANSFTLIELLVVIAIIGLLASVTVPAVGKALDKGKLTSAFGQMKSWGDIERIIDLEGDTNLSSLPGTNASDLGKWYAGIVRAVGTNQALKMFTADTIKPTIWDTNTGPNVNPFFIYACDENNGDVMLTTRNWPLGGAGTGNGPALSNAKPFGKVGALLIRTRGQGNVLITPQLATSPVSTWGVISNVIY